MSIQFTRKTMNHTNTNHARKKHYETHNKKTAAKWHKWHWLIHFFVKVEWKNHVPWKLSSISRKWGKFGFHFIFSTFSFSLNVYDRSLYDISLFYFTIFMFHCFQIFHYFLRFSVFTNVLFIVQCFCFNFFWFGVCILVFYISLFSFQCFYVYLFLFSSLL